MTKLKAPAMKNYINIRAGYENQLLPVVVSDVPMAESGLLPVPDGAQLSVLWKHGDYVFYKESQGYFPGDVEWDWRHSSENVDSLRAGAHANARIVWDIANDSNKLTSSS